MWAQVAVVLGAILVVDVVHFHLDVFGTKTTHPQDQGLGAPKMRGKGLVPPRNDHPYVMPQGTCNMSWTDTDAGDVKPVNPIQENSHYISTAVNPNYGVHLVVVGIDGKIYHRHQTGGPNGEWSDMKCITPDLTKVPCSSKPHCRGYDGNPAMLWQPVNGTLVVFVRHMDDLVPHEFHLTDPKNPDSWSTFRGPTCLCNFPPCPEKNQTKCGVVSSCDNQGVDCNAHPETGREFWHTAGPIFPTSEMVLLPDDEGKINMYFRGFTGTYWKVQQVTAGDAAGKYGSSQRYKVIIH